MRIPLFLITFCFIFTTSCQDRVPEKEHPTLYAVAELPVPVLNTPDFSFVFGNKEGETLHLDDSGLICEVEFIALPETVFEIKETIKKGNNIIYRITTADYPYPAQKGYFIDSRFVKTMEYKPPNRLKIICYLQRVPTISGVEITKKVYRRCFLFMLLVKL